ncbi:glutamine--fructose-6-phosphate transaminase (isomerizing) [Methylocystis sp. MJC1]|jgi:glucosamine--fructose-6-phosphate aminotransferase (isomerizing)|uniref:glutamine--fructose-6-phosphate transaminase (isomerizing) n=1 Tax=Methylocystis sp. MJC1 TaxID=2654282 RepID=UPI0013ED1DB9|nr:glutamine--fructose-6-phosphate transaminase (isomerizing) [Methylocystis sp. MJC1]KAF2989460.1 Glutamine--fructose-6-phosphate aminotransferase [isomerizing] [Methylocystis sp. MJC1]MBU6527949.1 glutamine--fructose-6-phosphate transaminase (isomerizing) [Methylocystis sp. MJC1]UZX10869.1 glutamine--fructose-6-phosphate transaminase (isomerizing) [Methylocystis sp. MJC1]
MCGIVGILGKGPVAGQLVEALKRLEYRGYDSAGIATLEEGRLTRLRASGKLKNLEEKLAATPMRGSVGIGHTRWATHGKPNEDNAHPHANSRVAVVHNGIIENFRELREELMAKGHAFTSQTDSEVVAHLVADEMQAGMAPQAAVAAALKRLKGAFALAFLFNNEPDLLIGARRGSPLAVGWSEEGAYLGSDALALAPFATTIAYLDEGDWVVLRRGGAQFFDAQDAPVERRRLPLQQGSFLVDKGNYRHFMAKEIHEQPEVVGRTLSHYLDLAEGVTRLPFELNFDPSRLSRVTISACGTAYYAGLVARYWLERFARLPVEIDIASEFRYRDPPLAENGLMIVVSQSGETADTLAALRYAKAHSQHILSIVNVETSTIARESHTVAKTLAGPEIGVASTKAFTCQLAVFACLALALGRARGVLTKERERELVSELIAAPGKMAEALSREAAVEPVARDVARASSVLYLGRGPSFPLAMEGALKLKELSYIHAEGYAAGELKHGPIALIDYAMPVIVLAPPDASLEKTVSNLQEVAARGGHLILIGSPRAKQEAAAELAGYIEMPETVSGPFAAIVYAVPAQLLAYHVATFMGKDVDQPRNLAKSVTVE